MSLIKALRAQLGMSGTATRNFTLTAEAADGSMKLARGNAGATTQDILTVGADGLVTLNQGKQLTLGTVQNSTSGTSIDFTGIPSWVMRITIMLNGVSTSGISAFMVQLGDAGGLEATGYLSSSATDLGTTRSTITNGMALTPAMTAATTFTGVMTITLMERATNTWMAEHNLYNSAPYIAHGAGVKALTETLDRIRITTVGGTDTFDAGSINIMYEG